jgi:hypothetical protein
MTTGGWIFMTLSWSAILIVFMFSLIRTLREKE